MRFWKPPKGVDLGAESGRAALAKARGVTKLEPLPADPWEFLVRCCWTYDERAKDGQQPLKRFPEKAYLRVIVGLWQAVKLLHVKKSRQLLITWLFAGLYLHKALTRRGTRVAWFCLTWAKAFKHIKSRVYRMYRHIPANFSKPLAVMTEDGLLVFHDGKKELPTSWIVPMAAEAGKHSDAAEQMRSETLTDAYFDEAEFYPNQSELIHSTLPSAENVALISTANGDTYVNRLGYSTDIKNPIAPLDKPVKELRARGIEVWDRYGFRHVEVHYTADPDKDPETAQGKAWYVAEYNKFPDKLKWRREMELDSTVAAGVGVFHDVDRIVVRPQVYRPTLPVICGRDFGFTFPYAVFFQVEPTKEGEWRVHVLCEVTVPAISTEAFEKNYVAPMRQKYFPGAEVLEFGDPAGNAREGTSGVSDIQVLQSLGRQVRSRVTKVDARLLKVQSIISLGWLEVDPDLAPLLLAALRGGYYRDEHGKPEKDGVHDHPPDGFGYAIDCTFEFESPDGMGALVYRPEGLEDVKGGPEEVGGVWRPRAEDGKRRR